MQVLPNIEKRYVLNKIDKKFGEIKSIIPLYFVSKVFKWKFFYVGIFLYYTSHYFFAKKFIIGVYIWSIIIHISRS
jgi:hypothetical protein